MTIFRLCSTSMLALGLAVVCPSSHATSLASLLHLHSHLTTTRVPEATQMSGEIAELQLHNPNVDFREVEVGGRIYTVRPKHVMTITAPVGTPVYAACGMFRKHAKGALLTEVESGSRTVTMD